MVNADLVLQISWSGTITRRGAAMKDGKLVRGTGGGYLLAVDGKT